MEEIKIKVRHIVTLGSKSEWIEQIPKLLPKKNVGDEFIFIDPHGHTLTCGADFSAAEKLNYFPVKVYWVIRTSNALFVKENPIYLV